MRAETTHQFFKNVDLALLAMMGKFAGVQSLAKRRGEDVLTVEISKCRRISPDVLIGFGVVMVRWGEGA